MPNRAFILHWLSAFNSIEIEKYNSLLDNNVKVSVHKLFRNPTETGKNSTYNKDQWANRLALERIGGKVDILDLDKLSTTDYPCNNNECILVGNLYSCYYCARVEVHIGYIKDSLTGEWRIIKEEYIAKESQESCISNTEGTFYSTLDSITAMYNTGWNAEWFQNHRADKVKIYGDNKVPMFLDAINQKDYLKSFGYYHLTNQNLDSDDPACLDYNVINAFPKYQDYQYCYSHSYKNLKLSARLLNTEVKYEYNFNYDGNTFRLQSIQVIK